MKSGDKLTLNSLAYKQGVCKGWLNIVCIIPSDCYGVLTVERDGIKNPTKRYRERIHKDFFIIE